MGGIIDQIIELEWEMFQETQNIGGRASCQDDRRTFFLMRESQWKVLEQTVLEGFYQDLLEAKEKKRNMIAEKYGVMMESYDPEGFAAIADRLPERSSSVDELAEQILDVYMEWYEGIREQIPHIMGNGRPLRSEEDSFGNVSVETYMRGELRTFSEKTLACYLDYIRRKRAQGINLARSMYEEMAKAYGYKNLEEAEERLSRMKG